MKKYAVIVAGGSGSRMGATVPKQFLLLQGRPVLWYSLNTFLLADHDLSVILVAPAAHLDAVKTLVAGVTEPVRVRIVEGGETRFHSVRNGLRHVEKGSVVAVHDGVRCLASVDLVRQCFEQAERLGSAIPVVDCKDSVRWIEGDGAGVRGVAEEGGRGVRGLAAEGGMAAEGSRPLDRSRVKLVQTPQTFLSNILLEAYGKGGDGSGFTDEATVVEAAGHPVHLIEGEVNNIKITVPADLVFAEGVLAQGWKG